MYYKLTGTVQKVDYTASAANSSAISGQCRYVRLYATTDCHISISNPAVTATAAMTPLQAKDFEYYKVCLLYTSPSPRDGLLSLMPSSA